jgi:transcriptional regulator with XRE-family HTH domain
MASKANAGHSKRIDPADYGIDLAAVLEEIKPHLEHLTNAELGELAGLSRMVVSQTWNGKKKVSLGALAALADAAGGRLEVTFEPGSKGMRS